MENKKAKVNENEETIDMVEVQEVKMEEKKKSFGQRAKAFGKKHKKGLIAGALALGAGALLLIVKGGKKDSDDENVFELDDYRTDEEVQEEPTEE